MVEKDKSISNETIIRGFSIASLLPGPVAVNTVTYIGYSISGWLGAITAMCAVILPSMILMIGLAVLYTEFTNISEVGSFLAGVIPVVIALIISAAYQIGRKSLTSYKHLIILSVVLVLQSVFQGYWVFILSFIIGGALGYLFFKPASIVNYKPPKFSISPINVVIALALLGTFTLNFITIPSANINLSLAVVFSGISLTLFGGGYVMIPMLNDIVVIQQAWLTANEFMDAIALGQITPGPILISATFIGYKVSGILGAIIATIGIFLPSGLLVVLVAKAFDSVSESPTMVAISEGLKPVVLALILSSIFILAGSIENWWFSSAALLVSAILILRFKVNFLWLMLIAGIISIILES